MKNIINNFLIAAIVSVTFSFDSLASDFDTCVNMYKKFVDDNLNVSPEPTGYERTMINMEGYKDIEKSFPDMTFDELIWCMSEGKKLSYKSAARRQ